MPRRDIWRLGASLAALALSLAGPAAAANQPIVALWPDGAPGAPASAREEKVRVTPQGEHVVSSIDRPSITAYLPEAARATGAAIVIAPGGGHRELWMDHEGYRVAEALAARGVAAFVLKYRLAREEPSRYTVAEHAVADIARAVRLVRHRARDWRVDPARVGVMGFSAGGHLAGLLSAQPGTGAAEAADPIDRLSAKPAFQVLIYPGSIGELRVSTDTPPTFLLSGGDDGITGALVNLYTSLRQSGVPAELHVYAGIGHGFGVRPSNPAAIGGWLARVEDWLQARGLLACAC